MCPPLRLLYAHNGADMYGAGRMLVRTISSLDRQRFAPFALLPHAGPLSETLADLKVPCIVDPGLSIVTRPMLKSWRLFPFLVGIPVSAFRLSRVIAENRIDLVHTNVGVVLSSALAARMRRVPHVWHIRECYPEFRAIWPLFASYIASANRVIAISTAVGEQFGNRPNVEVLHDGFDLEEFGSPSQEQRLHIRRQYALGDDFVVGCVGRIKFVSKGQEILVRSVRLLKERGHHVRALLVGAPFPGNEDHLHRLTRLIEELGVQDQVTLTGELRDVLPAYAAMDALALTSMRPEGLGNVALEAMGMRLPVIATRIGGPLDIVQEGVTGWLVTPGAVSELADKIQQLKEHPGLRRQMGEAGRRRLETHFSLRQMTRRLERLYCDLSNARSHPEPLHAPPAIP